MSAVVRLAILVAFVSFMPLGVLAASKTAGAPVEYWDEPVDRPPLDAALKILYRQCPILAASAWMMDKVLIDWSKSLPNAPPGTLFGWTNYVHVTFYVHDRKDFFDTYGPRLLSDAWAQDRIDYLLGAGAEPGIAPRDLLAYILCGQPLPVVPDTLLPSPGLSILSAPPSGG